MSVGTKEKEKILKSEETEEQKPKPQNEPLHPETGGLLALQTEKTEQKQAKEQRDMSMAEETMEHSGDKPKAQHELPHPLTNTGVGSLRSLSLRNDRHFQHYTSDCFTEPTEGLKRSKSTSDQKTNIIAKWCIYRVPSKLHNVNTAAYTPQLLSIGLFHYGKPELKDMEKHKVIYSQNFYKRDWEGMGKLSTTQKAVKLRNSITVSKESIIRCYAGTIDLDVNADQVVEIILVDACFIIELFLRNNDPECYDKDYILSSPWLRKAVELELILFENQLPYSLLQDLYYHASPVCSSSHPRKEAREPEFTIDIDKVKPVPFVELPEVPNACFPSMKLKLTPFCVKDDTECIIRNVMALEQFVYPDKASVCNYFMMMDKLVDTVEDVDFLVEKGVIDNMLGSNEAVAQLLNKLCNHIMDEKSCYTDICNKLNTRYDSSLNRHLVTLKRVYFKDVWTGSATFFGVVLVLLTIIEIIMSFKK